MYGDENGSENDHDGNNDDLESYSGKRHRTSDWPLKSTDKQDVTSKVPLGNRLRGNGSSGPVSDISPPPPRPSKFLEGSMNDRVSKRPHSEYIGSDEEMQLRYDVEQSEHTAGRKKQMGGVAHHTNRSVGFGSLAEKSETSRQSGMFRFGKSLSAAFNPSNWKIWSKKSQDGDDCDDDDLRAQIFRERRENAEKAYKDMKQTGYFQDFSHGTGSNSKYGGLGSAKHDSGFEFGQRFSVDSFTTTVKPSSHIPNEEKRYGRVYLEPPGIPTAQCRGSPLSETSSSPDKPSFHFKKPSLSNLKLAPGSLHKLGSADDNTYDAERLKRLPSHKDLHKQQKLVKRVSDLEGKLDTARRQLSEALGEPVPDIIIPNTRPRFKPGNLATLPSERLLSSYLSTVEVTAGANADIGMAVSTNCCLGEIGGMECEKQQSIVTDPQMEAGMASSPTVPQKLVPVVPLIESKFSQNRIAKADARDTAVSSTSEKDALKKRKSIGFGMAGDDDKYSPRSDDSDESEEFEGTNKRSSKQKTSRAGRLRKVNSTRDLPGAVAVEQNKTKDWTYGDAIHKLHGARGRAVLSKKATSTKKNDSKIPRAGHQFTTPPSNASIIGSTAIPISSTFDTEFLPGDNEDDAKDEGNCFDVCPTRDAPPVPKVPRIVRLASGEVINIPGAAVASVAKAAATNAEVQKVDVKAVYQGGHMHELEGEEKGDMRPFEPRERFEWPADVF